MPVNRRIGLIVGADSYLLQAQALADVFSAENWDIEIFCATRDGSPVVSERQLNRDKAASAEVVSSHFDLDHPPRDWAINWGDFDALFVGLPALRSSRFLKFVETLPTRGKARPVTISSFPGVLYYLQSYGQYSRSAADILLFNERRTFDDYRLLRRIFPFIFNGANEVLYGYMSVGGISKSEDSRAPIVYIDQNVLPESYEHRKAVFSKLIKYANEHAKRELIFLARNEPGEQSNHACPDHHHVDFLVREILKEQDVTVPVSVSYAAPRDILKECSVCIGFTSTVLIEAICASIPTVVLRADGVSGSFNGAKLFQDTSFAVSIDELASIKQPPQPCNSWMEENIFVPGPEEKKALIENVENLIQSRETLSKPHWRKRFRPSPVILKPFLRVFDFWLHRKLNY